MSVFSAMRDMAATAPPRAVARNVALIVAGSLVFAVGLDCFTVPAGLAAGGVSGLATVFAAAAASAGATLPVGVQTLAMNAALMVVAYRFGGARYVARSVLGVVASGVLTDALAPHLPVLASDDMLLCAIWGGVVCGAGLGMVFRTGGNTGGTDVIAQLAAHRTAVSVGTASLAADAVVVAVSVPVFGLANALYAVVSMYVCSRVVDVVVDGFNAQRAAYVISDAGDEIKARVLEDMDRGCTELMARGGYTGEARPVLLVVLSRSETAVLKDVVAEVDPGAIVIISEVHEAFGEGFRNIAGS